jgi:prepilin signal peptidase PulO-like enzyme (type II secretory pathway)
VLVGATLGAVLISPFLRGAAGGLLFLRISFVLSSVSGAVVGYGALKVLRRSEKIERRPRERSLQ